MSSKIENSALRQLLISLLGPDITNDALDQLNRERSYKYNNFVDRLNIEAAPGDYLNSDPKNYSVESLDEWYRSPNPGAYGRASFLGGIRIPKGRMANMGMGGLLGTIAHENSHISDMFSNFRNREINFSPELHEAFGKHPGFIGHSGQLGDDEVMAQLRAYEAMAPAGQRVLNSKELSPLFKNIRDKVRFYNRRYPLPEGLDAMTGMRE